YEEEAGRKSAFEQAIADGIQPGYGASDGTALHFVGSELLEVVSSRPHARAHYVSSDGDGGAIERELPVNYLGARPPPPAHAVDPGEAIAAGRLSRRGALAARPAASSPWAVAASQWRSARRCLTCSC